MRAGSPDWPGLLHDYETAIAEFDSVSRALTSALVGRSADDDVRGLVESEERARETVVLARMRIINLWRQSGAEPPDRAAPPA